MGHERAFLADIIAHPDDDGPRLIFADWLDDHDQADRAEFIRLQCRLACLGGDDPCRKPLQARERQLLNAHSRRWARLLLGVRGAWAFRRGFLECVAVPRSDHQAFRARRDHLFAAAPLRALRLEGDPNLLHELLARPDYLARLESLDVKGLETADPQRVVDGLTQPQAAGLRKLHLPFTRFALSTAKLLADAPTRANLTHLDLGCAHITEPGWRRLLDGVNTRRLRWLGLFGANVERGGSASLQDHSLGQELRALLGPAADFDTSDTFPRWAGRTWGD